VYLKREDFSIKLCKFCEPLAAGEALLDVVFRLLYQLVEVLEPHVSRLIIEILAHRDQNVVGSIGG
jgi:hypothetical protein